MNIPTIFTQVEFFYSLACYTVILSCTFCAIVRWCHMCHPFDKQGDYFLLCCHRLAVAIRAVPGRSWNMVFRTKLWHSLLSRMLCHALPPLFPNGKDVAKGVVLLLFPHPFPAARRFVHHCGFPCGVDSSALQTAMGMCRRRHEHPAVHTYDKSRQMAHQEG